MKMRFISTCLAVAMTTVSVPAFAATLVINPITATWQNIVIAFPASLETTGAGTANTTIRWGQPAAATKAGFNFTAAATPFNVGFVPNGASGLFSLGNFTHDNQPTFANTGNLTAAKLKVTYGVTLDGDDLGSFDSVFGFLLDETSNGDNPCPFGGANGQGANINGCADRVRVALDSGGTQNFTIDGVQYALNINGFLLGGNPTSEFLTIESATNTASLQASISARNLINAVPEPATWAMMIGGFGMVGSTMRYRRRKTTVSFA